RRRRSDRARRRCGRPGGPCRRRRGSGWRPRPRGLRAMSAAQTALRLDGRNGGNGGSRPDDADAAALFEALAALDVRLTRVPDPAEPGGAGRLRVDAPCGALTDALRAALRVHRDGLLRLLEGDGSSLAREPGQGTSSVSSVSSVEPDGESASAIG